MARTADRDANHALRARFDDVYADYQRLRAGLGELQRRLAALSASASSPDGLVRATVGPRGQLVALRLDPRIYRDADPEALAAKITSTVRAATEEAGQRVAELVAGYLPAGSGTVDFLKDNDFGALMRRHDAALREETERDA